MHRPNLNNMPATDRATLAGLIQQYVTPAVVDTHWNAVLSGAHNDPAGFLSFHRNFIGGLEDFLSDQGYPQWVPLPAWNPAEPIPAEFNIPSTGPDRLRNLNPNVSFSPRFGPENLANFTTVEELGEAIIPVHNLVHTRIGGVMNDLRRAPEAPIFWPFHAFIDDIWWNWQRITVVVPSCIGLTMNQAGNLLRLRGLGLINVKTYNQPQNAPIRHQKPAPYTIVPRGTLLEVFL